MTERCSEWVSRDWRSGQCHKQGKVERNGKWYCTQHDPVRKAEKRATQEADHQRLREEARQDWKRKKDRRQAELEAVALIVRLAKEAPSWAIHSQTQEAIRTLATRLEATR